MTEEVEEPVAFTETAWNLVLVLGLTGSGTLDACIACLLLICSAAMQITFSVILFGEEHGAGLGHAQGAM
eukprot:g25942.t1